MTPNLLKGDKYSSSLPKDRYDDPNHPSNDPKFQANKMSSDTAQSGNAPDGDHTAKGFEQGADSALNSTEFSDGIHESGHQGTSAGEKTTGQGTSIFSKDGAIGAAFTGKGAIGAQGNKVGGPLSSSGAIGKQFEAGGAVGSTFQELAKKNENH